MMFAVKLDEYEDKLREQRFYLNDKYWYKPYNINIIKMLRLYKSKRIRSLTKFMIVMIEKNKYEKIIDIINEPYTNKDVKPNFYNKRISTDHIFIQFDTPRKEGAYHGSTFDIRCIRDICHVSGEIVTKREFEKNISDKIIETGCNIRTIHQHPESIMATLPGKQYKKEEFESHIHITCINKDYDDTIKIAKFLREY